MWNDTVSFIFSVLGAPFCLPLGEGGSYICGMSGFFAACFDCACDQARVLLKGRSTAWSPGRDGLLTN